MRGQLVNLLRGKGAHMTFDDAVADFPVEAINVRPANVPYTFWQLIEHIRICQWDILEFTINPEHVSPAFPDGYWPDPETEASPEDWQRAVEQFHTDLRALEDLVQDANIDLASEIPHAPGYTYLREILLVADHNAYHTGELAILRQVMDLWP